jgi:hypothetical protein
MESGWPSCEGIVLKTHALGDTSLIVVAYTRDTACCVWWRRRRAAPQPFGYARAAVARALRRLSEARS